MAQKSGTFDTVEFIPSMEKKDPKPLTVYFRPLTKAEYDSYTNSLGEFKKNKFISKGHLAFQILCDKSLTANKDGVFLKNVWLDGKFLETVTEKSTAVTALFGLQNVDCANEIELAMKSQSTLDEDEIKNSDGQSDVVSK